MQAKTAELPRPEIDFRASPAVVPAAVVAAPCFVTSLQPHPVVLCGGSIAGDVIGRAEAGDWSPSDRCSSRDQEEPIAAEPVDLSLNRAVNVHQTSLPSITGSQPPHPATHGTRIA